MTSVVLLKKSKKELKKSKTLAFFKLFSDTRAFFRQKFSLKKATSDTRAEKKRLKKATSDTRAEKKLLKKSAFFQLRVSLP